MTSLTTILAELEEAERAATPGPWRTSKKDPVRVVTESGIHVALTDPMHFGHPRQEANARLIALMRNHLPTLIEAVKSAQKLVPAVDDLISDLKNGCRRCLKPAQHLRRPLMSDIQAIKARHEAWDRASECNDATKDCHADRATLLSALSAAEARADAAEARVGELREALERLLLEFDFLVEAGELPDIRNDMIFEAARTALEGSEQ